MKPKITCAAIIRRGNKILLTKRNVAPYKNYWCFPGGHVEWKERVEEAIKREVKEETNLNFKPEFFNYYNEIISKINWHAVVLVFVGSVRGKFKIDKNEVKDFQWFSEKEAKRLKLAFKNRWIVEDYFQSKKDK